MKDAICIMPIKAYSERIPSKNFKLINGVPLYQIFATTLNATGLFELYIDTDSPQIAEWCHSCGIGVITRQARLARDDANGNLLLRHHVSILDMPDYSVRCKYYWQAFCTSPYISIESVQKMDEILRNPAMGVDSVVSVEALRGQYWIPLGGTYQPISYRPECMPRSQDLPPIYREICGLFGITREAFEYTQTRFGRKPYFFELPHNECLDIDWPEDLPKMQTVNKRDKIG